jgi:exodeoxyribonuclease V alpha subunit
MIALATPDINANSRRVLWPSPWSIPELTPHQQQQADLATTAPVGILCGTPGTGKTYTAAALVRATVPLIGGTGLLAVAAPTGKAAVRCTESMQRYGLDVEATTIHRMLGIRRNGYDGNGWGFHYNETNPLPFRVIVIDEASMLDTDLAASLFKAIAPGTHVLFVGDPYQLPPVGHGAPLRDMLAARDANGDPVIPSGEVTEIKRNAGTIVQACATIRAGTAIFPPRPDQFDVVAGVNWRHHEAIGTNAQVRTLEHLIRSSPPSLDPVWDIQVLCAVNDSGELCRKKLNTELQRILNPAAGLGGSEWAQWGTPANCPFRVGDKVICTSNSFQCLHEDEDGDIVPRGAGAVRGGGNESFADDGDEGEPDHDRKDFVANGEIGRVELITEREILIRFFGPKRVIAVPMKAKKAAGDAGAGNVGIGANNGNGSNDTPQPADGAKSDTGAIGDFDLAYAITTHKAQGSQARVIVVLIDDLRGAGMVTSREWWYTAFSRAEKVLITIGRIGTLNKQCRKVALTGRKTFLRERLCEGSAT